MPTVNNEKVSNLVGLSATELAADDLFFVGDVSAKESKRLTAGELLTYFNVSSSINALTAVTANTASWAYNVINIPPTASFALTVISASYALQSANSVTASYALTAPTIGTTDTASYLLYSGNHNGTASYAMVAGTAINVTTASFLQYTAGVNNGTVTNALTASTISTSSYAYSSSVAVTSSFATYTGNASASILADSASYVNPLFVYNNTPIKAWAWVTWSLGVTQPKIIEQYNIEEIKYLNRFTETAINTAYPVTWSQFAVEFTNPVQTVRYMLMGDGYQPFGDPERAGVMMHPYHDSRSYTGFTMSVITQGPNDFYLGVPGAYGNNEYGFITFQIIGAY